MGKKNSLSMRSKIRAEKERERRVAIGMFLVFVLIVALSVYFTYQFLNPSQNQIRSLSSGLRAAIVDQVSLTFPNQTFIETATKMLEQANYSVDYYSGEKVTVNFFRNLSAQGYGLIVLRIHSSAASIEGKEFVETPVSLFTCESYSTNKYVWEQLNEQLVIGSYSMPQPPYYFGITPKFVTSSMNGRFQKTTVLMMGCEGLDNAEMAEAFTEKGAKTYVSWNGSVSESYADQATIQLLQYLVAEKQTIKQAVQNTLKKIGPDPACNNTLEYYPLESGDYSLQ